MPHFPTVVGQDGALKEKKKKGGGGGGGPTPNHQNNLPAALSVPSLQLLPLLLGAQVCVQRELVFTKAQSCSV